MSPMIGCDLVWVSLSGAGGILQSRFSNFRVRHILAIQIRLTETAVCDLVQTADILPIHTSKCGGKNQAFHGDTLQCNRDFKWGFGPLEARPVRMFCVLNHCHVHLLLFDDGRIISPHAHNGLSHSTVRPHETRQQITGIFSANCSCTPHYPARPQIVFELSFRRPE